MTDKILCEIKSFATEGIFHLAVSNIVGNRYDGVVNGTDIYLKRETYTTVSLWIQDPKLSWISLGTFVTDSKYHAIQEIIGKLKLYFQEDTMTNMTKAELEQKYWEAQRRIDEYEMERDRFLKDIDERDQSISDLIDANEKLTKENDKLSVDISKKNDEIDSILYELNGVQIKLSNKTRDYETYKHLVENLNDENTRLNNDILSLQDESQDDIAKLGSELDKAVKKHDAATEKCKDLAKDVEFWKGKAYEMDKKNCELRSRNRELEKELAEKSKQFDMKIEVTPETCYQIDILAREVDRLEKELRQKRLELNDFDDRNKNLRSNVEIYCKKYYDAKEHIDRLVKENNELSRINSVRLGDINRLQDKVDKINGYLHSIDDAYSEMPVNKLRQGYYDGMVKFCNDVFDILDDWKKL